MNDVTLALIGLFVVALVIVIIIARKNKKIKELEENNKHLVRAINLSARIIGQANVMDVSPKELPKEFDE